MNTNTQRYRHIALICFAIQIGCNTSPQQAVRNPLRPGDKPAADSAFFSPQGITATNRYLLVVNAAHHFVDGVSHWDEGFVTVIDRRSRQVVRKIPTTQRNPHDVIVHDNIAYIVNTGTTLIDDAGLVYVDGPGGIDVLPLTDDVAQLPHKMAASIPLGKSASDNRIGSYGSIVISEDGRYAFVGSGTRGDLFQVDLAAQRVIRGPDNPIAMFPTRPGFNGLTVVRPASEGMAVLNFNTDELCIVSLGDESRLSETRCHVVGVNRELIEGPIDVVQVAPQQFLVLMTIANAVYHVDLGGPSARVTAPWAATDLANNQLQLDRSVAYVINSTSNNLQRIDTHTGQSTSPHAILPIDSNPYAMTLTDEPEGRAAWVTLFSSHAIALVRLRDGEVVLQLQRDSKITSPTQPDAKPEPPEQQQHPPARQRSCEQIANETIGIAQIDHVSFGEGAGHNQDHLPDVVRGLPQGGGGSGGVVSGVLSLGSAGEIVVSFGAYEIVDGPGDDFIVFENPFLVGPYNPFAEPAVVGVQSLKDAPFSDFVCELGDTHGDSARKRYPFSGCAGVRPVHAYVAADKIDCIDPADPAVAGGDAFDLADVGLKSARAVRLVDAGISNLGVITRGFDLDAIVLVNYRQIEAEGS